MTSVAIRALFSAALLTAGVAGSATASMAAAEEVIQEAAEDAAVILLQVGLSSTAGTRRQNRSKKASILIPQGANDGDYTGFEQPRQVFPFDALNRSKFANGGSCVATVIHPRHAVTAANCLAGLGINATHAKLQVTINGKSYTTSGVLFHPRWSCLLQGPIWNDLALLRFAEDLDVTPAPLYETSDEKGKDFFMMGWGDVGRPTDTRFSLKHCTATEEGCKFRLARNRFTVAGYMLDYKFDDPSDQKNIHSVPDEGLAANGDTGSPAIILGQVAGVHSYSACCRYGSVGHYTRISKTLSWIRKAVAGNYSIKKFC